MVGCEDYESKGRRVAQHASSRLLRHVQQQDGRIKDAGTFKPRRIQKHEEKVIENEEQLARQSFRQRWQRLEIADGSQELDADV